MKKFISKEFFDFKKILLKMRITCILLIVCASTLWASESMSQTARTSISINDATVLEIISSIEAQTDYLFVYDKTEINVNRRVNLKANDQTVATVLSTLFDNTNTVYAMEGSNIFLMSKTEGIQQQNIVTGTVVDENGVGLPGVNVTIKGTSTGVMSDVDGKYDIAVPNSSAIIQFSFIGYTSQEVTVGNKSVINITLAEDAQLLEEVVVVGYGVQKKSNITGSISSVKTDDIVNRTIDNLGQALQGKTAGVQTLSSSGAPGASTSIRIRGYSSNSASEPLVVVDGVKNGSYSDINDIASIEVLKDGASAAIYGAEAGNGVILITTKSGSKNTEGKITYNGMFTTQKAGKLPEVMDADKYIDYMILSGVSTQEYFDSNWDGVTDTNWANEMFETGIIQRHTLSFSGGTDKGSIYSSLTWNDNNGMLKGMKDIYERISLQLNADYQVKKWFKLSTAATISMSDTKSVSSGSSSGSVMGAAVLMDPLTPVETDVVNVFMQDALDSGYELLKNPESGHYWGVSNYTRTQANPFILRDATDPMSKTYGISGNITALFTPIKDLTYTSRLGYGINTDYNTTFNKVYFAYGDLKREKIEFSANFRNSYNYLWENFVNYSKKLGDHSLSFMAGMSYQYRYNANISGSTNELTNIAENYRSLDNAAGTAIKTVGGGEIESSSISYYGRAAYNYKNLYDFQVTMRADAYDSSKLHEDSRWGYFPSAAAGWTISNEEFFAGINKSIISNLKLRGSYGVNGNVNILSGYPYASTLSLSGYYPFNVDGLNNVNGATPSTRQINPNLHWETTNHLDIGIDARFLNDRLSLTMDYFNKNTSGMLLSSIPPASTGATSVYLNAGMVNNHGFEFELGWQDRIGQDFTYGINGNFATLSNTVVELNEVDFIKGSGNVSQTITYFEEGHDIWYYRAYRLAGIDQTTGAAIYEDINNDGQITESDRVDVGSGVPKLTYGTTINLGYKSFDISILGSGVAGFNIFSAIFLPDRPGSNRYSYFYDDAWLPTNTPEENLTKRYPRPNQGDDKILISDAMLNKGDFFKIKQMQLGYTLPTSILRKIEISSLRFYVSLEDFITFTSYPGIDPEIVSAGGGNSMGLDRVSYPISKKVSVGINLTF